MLCVIDRLMVMSNPHGRPRKTNHAAIIEHYLDSTNTVTTARQFGISSCYVQKILRQNNIKTIGKPGRNPVFEEEASRVIDYVMQHGGAVTAAIRKLNAKVTHQTVLKTAKRKGIYLLDFKHMSKECAHWLVTQPGYRRTDIKGQFLVPVTCKHCGNTDEISQMSLDRGKFPKPCKGCGAGTNPETGKPSRPRRSSH